MCLPLKKPVREHRDAQCSVFVLNSQVNIRKNRKEPVSISIRVRICVLIRMKRTSKMLRNDEETQCALVFVDK